MEKPETRIVAYVDILGFTDLVKTSLDDASAAKLVESALERAIQWVGTLEALDRPNAEDWHIRIFSDCACISQPSSAPGLLRMIQGISYFQREMLAAGFAVRGGISVGPHVESNLMLFSKALIQAYELESQLADYPRIIVSSEVLELLECVSDDELRQEIKEYLVIEGQGLPFVCYMVFEEYDPWFMGEKFYLLHKQLIESELTRHSENKPVRRKYGWLAEFHNWCLRETAELLKTGGIMSEDDVWSFSHSAIKIVTETRSFRSLLWTDRAFSEANHTPREKGIDWIRQWPHVSSEDDEKEPDDEPDN